MLALLRLRKYRIVLAANLISLFGSGLSHAGIIWYVLQQTHSEKAVALLVGLMTMPSLLVLPFSGILIDRMDRRHLLIALDASRGFLLALVSAAAWAGRLEVWMVYAVGVLLGVGAFVFWPTLAALIQELVEADNTVQVNALLMGAAQSGWMFAGTAVGLIYGRWGIAGVLTLDCLSYVASATLYTLLRKGKNLEYRRHAEAHPVSGFAHELAAGVRYALANRFVLVIGMAWALGQAAMMSQNVLTAPLNDKILKTGAVGFGLCAAGWSLGAIVASGAAGAALRNAARANAAIWIALTATGAACIVMPFSAVLPVAVALYFVMGGGRGLGGVAVSSALIHEVPRHLMGRTQNLITFVGIVLQLVMTFGTGWLSENVHLAMGFLLVGSGYLAAGAMAYTIRNHTPALPDVPEQQGVMVAPEEI